MSQGAEQAFADHSGDELPPWRRHFPDVADWDGPVEIMTLPDLLAAGLARAGERPLITFRERTIGFPEFAARVDQLAAGLLTLGLTPGSVVGLHLPNTPFHPLAFFAAARAGLAVMHLSGLDAPREIEHKLRVSGARVLITTNLPGFLPVALRFLDAGAADTILVGDDAEWGASMVAEPIAIPERTGLVSLAQLLTASIPAAWPQRQPGDVVLLQFTGGTTGLPKAAMLSQGNLTAAVSMHRLWRDYLEPGETLDAFEASMRTIGVLPLFHIYALTVVLLRAVRGGGEILLRQRFDPGEIIADIAVRRATFFAGVPTMWLALLNHPGIEAVDFSALRCCISGGAPLPFEAQTRLCRLLGRDLVTGWGMTETAPAGTLLPRRALPRPGVIGIPFPKIRMRVVALDDPSRMVAPGETGELAIQGPNVFAGYLGQPEETQRAFCDDWFLTGDVGRVDELGVFDIIDRRKNMIISGGFNVYPVQIEGAIYEHPDVAEVIVIGIPDAYLGQVPKAFVTLKPRAAPFTLEALADFLIERVGRYEIPRALELREALPRSPAGKLLASVLVAEERAKGETQEA
ncbi:dicarboxylate--CoA ligase PimA [Methylorubrum extorquens]|uniref:AMP-binding protein n=1 Tax=Methylorubrum extorquens TaxID=408 RepID=UPI00116E8507|nr:AMP-binding protein [Methylorubrum extorquens]GEL39931.1 dicarboxylate--CoA ligase PimA [Methylorubrum extorquens]